MALTEGDKAECKEIARMIIQEVLEQHIQSCPWGKKILISKWVLIGACIGGGAAGGSVVLGIVKAIFGI